MSVSTFIAIRYLKANRENRFFSWIALLSIAGIAIGVAAMIVVLAVINGFEMELRNKFLVLNSHIMIYQYPSGMRSPEKWADLIKNDFPKEILGISPFVHSETMAQKDSMMHPIMIRGIDPAIREKVQKVYQYLSPTSAFTPLQEEIEAFRKNPNLEIKVPSIVVGKGLLSLLNAKIGDTIELIAAEDATTIGDMKKFKVVGIYDSGLNHYDNKIGIVSLNVAQKFLKMDTRVTGLEIGLRDPEKSIELSQKMAAKYTVSIKEWHSFNKPLFEAMEMERAVIAAIVFLVAFVASFNILTTLFVSVSQKQRDISILKALGSSTKQIQWLFIQQGTLIGILGSLIGVVLALVISELLERYQFIELPDLYLLSMLPIVYDWRVYLGVALAGVCICVLAGIYPARVAAKVTPSEGFRGGRNQA